MLLECERYVAGLLNEPTYFYQCLVCRKDSYQRPSCCSA